MKNAFDGLRLATAEERNSGPQDRTIEKDRKKIEQNF